jgi:type IV pilus assembly protein PilC
MAQFKYSAVTKGGEKVNGVIDAFNEMDAAARIRQTCDVILKIQDVSEEKPNLLALEIGGNKLNAKAFTVMCSQFAIILRAGVSLARAVHLIADKTTDKKLKRLLKQVAEDVEGGRSLSASFEDHGGKFLPATFIETLRAGEASGAIDRSFETMQAHFDKQVKTKAKVKSALAYPLFVIAIAIIVVAVVMIVVIPKLTPMFTEFGGEIPFMMNSLIVVSEFFQKYILVMIAFIAAIIIGVKLYGNTENGRIALAKLQLKLPVLGNIATLSAASEFANSMAALMNAGLPLPRALSITARTMSNYFLSTECGKLSGELEAGRALGQTMREQGVMPDILTDMVSVGEETGEIGKTLETVAQFYDAELEEATKSALAKLEPAMLIFIAIFAGYIVIAIYTGMFSMYGNM